MRARIKKPSPPGTVARARTARSRQRQRLIDACISALHVYGPSRTTVGKVVAIAQMSPGIVRFYFDSKAAMLVASLRFLAAEFEERLLVPVARLRDNPVAALELMVHLYLDPEIASARKVSVWYSFWGEASSRQEYYDICGQKDDRFAALVRELIERLIVATRQSQLDPDGVALGLIGVLEMLWQGIAFQTEVSIDREAARHRCMAYLRSIFPGQFALSGHELAAPGVRGEGARRLPRWSYDSAALYAIERDQLFRGAWQLAGHQRQLSQAGDYLALELGAERALLVRDESGALRAFRNSCPAEPHALVCDARGRLPGLIACEAHGLRFALDGAPRATAGGVSLRRLDLDVVADLVFVRAPGAGAPAKLSLSPLPAGLLPMAPAYPEGPALAADWKIVVEQMLGAAMPEADEARQSKTGEWTAMHLDLDDSSGALAWSATLASPARGWSARQYRRLLGDASPLQWRRLFMPPSQLMEIRADGVSLLQILPVAAGRSIFRRFDYSLCASARAGQLARYLAGRLGAHLRPSARAIAESAQRGIVAFGYEASDAQGAGIAANAFRGYLALRVPAIARAAAPIGLG